MQGSPTFVGEVSCKYTISWTSSLFCPRPLSFLQQNCSIQDDETGLQYDLTPLKGTTYFAPAGYYTNSNGQESYYSYHSYIGNSTCAKLYLNSSMKRYAGTLSFATRFRTLACAASTIAVCTSVAWSHWASHTRSQTSRQF